MNSSLTFLAVITGIAFSPCHLAAQRQILSQAGQVTYAATDDPSPSPDGNRMNILFPICRHVVLGSEFRIYSARVQGFLR